MREIKNAIINPYIFSVISKIMIVILGFAFTVCQSRYLGPAIKGDVAYVSSISSILVIIFGFGIHQAYPYYKKKWNKEIGPLFMMITIMVSAMNFVLALSIVLIFKPSIIYSSIILLTPLLVYSRLVSYICMVESPNKKNASEMLADFFVLEIVIIMWLFIPASLLCGLFLLAIKDVILSTIYTIRLRRFIKKTDTYTMRESLYVFKFGFFPMLALLMTTLNYRVDVIMLNHFVSNTQLGIYSVGVMLAERVWIIPDALKEVMISNISKGKGSNEVGFVVRICNTVCMLIVLSIVALGTPFIRVFFGSEYSGAYSVTCIILIGIIFMIYYKMVGAYNIVVGKQKENLKFLTISVISNVIMNLMLIPKYGINGAAFASVVSYAISAFLFACTFLKSNSIPLKDFLFITRGDVAILKQKLQK